MVVGRIIVIPPERLLNQISVMGLLTDVFLATNAELTSGVLGHGPRGLLPTVEGRGFDWGAAQKLAHALDIDSPPNPNKSFLEPIELEGSAEACICRISHKMVVALAATNEEDQALLREKWMGREEPDGLGMKSDAQIWFEEFMFLMRQAVAQGKDAFVWICP